MAESRAKREPSILWELLPPDGWRPPDDWQQPAEGGDAGPVAADDLGAWLRDFVADGDLILDTAGHYGAFGNVGRVKATVALGRGWTATITLRLDDDDGVVSVSGCTAVELRPPDGQPPTTRDLTRFGLKDVYRRIERGVPSALGAMSPGQAARYVTPRPGRDYDDTYYALVARDYVWACAAAPNRPVAFLAEHNPGKTRAMFRRWLGEAKLRKLLVGHATGGRERATGKAAGGRLSAKAERLIKEATP